MATASTGQATCLVHATAIAVDGRAALIRGPSGAGKSDLALRCILGGAHLPLAGGGRKHVLADLVSDDQVLLDQCSGVLRARAPGTIAGLIEVRGVGCVRLPAVSEAAVALVVDLMPDAQIARLPDPPTRAEILGVGLPVLQLDAHLASSHFKLLMWLGGPHAERA